MSDGEVQDRTSDLEPGRWYGEGHGHARRIVSIRDGMVTYALKGVLSFAPQRCTVQEFRQWARENAMPAGLARRLRLAKRPSATSR